VGTEVWRYVALTAHGRYEEAYQVIREANPFPSACARVCNHPCESACRMGVTGGDPIAARTLKRFVVDHIDPSVYRPVVLPAGPEAKKVAVIGAGPSGLTVAHYLSLRGHRITVFEELDRPGGMLTSAIPSYRLPRDVLNKEIESLLNDNIQVEYGKSLGRDFTIESLRKDGFDAIYVALGSQKSRRLGVPGEDVDGVLHGIEFLKEFNIKGSVHAQGRVGIIGGGNSAVDAARVARRQKRVTGVTIYYRRTEAEMPAYHEEIEAAIEEGIEIIPLVTPVEVLSRENTMVGIRFLKNELGDKDSSGRRSPVPVKGSEFDVALDTLIVAISEEPAADALAGLKVSRWKTLDVNPESLQTSQPGVFGGGDVVSGPRTVIEAIGDGKRAALMIDRYLHNKMLKKINVVKLPSVFVEPSEAEESDDVVERVRSPLLPVQQRHGCFKEVELGVTEIQAVREARRCLRCDLDFTQPA
jgi:NADH-quinone oxidoreductase subunit F